MKTRLLFTLVLAAIAWAANAATITYTYDNAGRLTSADYGGNNLIAYAYDANGNLTQRVVAAASEGTGYVTCAISPAAVTNDARWQLTTGTDTNWKASGATLAVAPGAYTLAFNAVAGWQTPATQPITVVANETNQLTATYVAQLIPPTAVLVNGPSTGQVNQQITFTATVQPANASPVINYTWSPEPYTLQFGTQAVYQFATAGNKTITVVAANDAGSATGSATIAIYTTQSFGYVSGWITPAAAIADGAQWRMTSQGSWYNNGTTQTLVSGSYTMEFKLVPGWTSPAPRNISVMPYMSYNSTGVYNHALSLSPGSLNFSAGNETQTLGIVIGTGGAWTSSLSSGALWISLDTNSGTGSYNLRVVAAANTNDRARSGEIQVNNQTVPVRQRGLLNSALGWLMLLFE